MIRDTHHLPQPMNVCLTNTSVLHQTEWTSLRFLNQNLRGISRIDGGIHENPESLNLVCGIPSRILGLNDCDELQTPEGWALVTDAKESMDSIPTWLRTDRWLAMLWQSIGTFSLRGWEVATDNGDALHAACRRRALQTIELNITLQEFRGQSISKTPTYFPLLHNK